MARNKNTGDEAAVREAQRRAKEDLDKETIELQDLLNNYKFRKYLWNKMSACGIFDGGFTGDPYLTQYNEGKRVIGLSILQEVLTAAPRQFTLMQSEAQQREREAEEDQ